MSFHSGTNSKPGCIDEEGQESTPDQAGRSLVISVSGCSASPTTSLSVSQSCCISQPTFFTGPVAKPR